MKQFRIIISVLISLMWGGSAYANTLGLSFVSPGQEDSTNLTINYDYSSPSSGHLSITGRTVLIYVTQDGGSSSTGYHGIFNLQAAIDPSTGQALTGSIKLMLPSYAGAEKTVWNSSVLTGFGYNSDLSEMDFTFIQSGPSVLAGVQAGSAFGVAVHALNGFNIAAPGWGADFTGTGAQNLGGALAVPAPDSAYAGLALFGIIGIGMWFRQRREGSPVY